MLSIYFYNQGAAVGTLVGLIFSFWIAIGAIVIEVAKSSVMLPFNTYNCTSEETNYTALMTTNFMTPDSMTTHMATTPAEEEE